MTSQPPQLQAVVNNDTEFGTDFNPTGPSAAGAVPTDASRIIAETQQQQNTADSLPGAEKPTGGMNWAGSSFSGVDIKVVAHLYGTLDTDQELDQLKQDQAIHQSIADGCSEALSAVTSLNIINWLKVEGVDGFLAATGLSIQEDNQKAIDTLRYIYQSTPKFNTSVFEMSLRNSLSNAAATHKSFADALTTKIMAREEIKQKSSPTAVLATLQTLSLQTHREKFAVRALGTSYPKGFTRSMRTIAGSMIFTMFNEHAFASLIRSMSGKGSIYGERDTDISSLIVDQLPPLDLTVIVANEYGQLSQLGIYGVEFMNDGLTMSIEDILTEEVVQFVARDCDILTSKGNIRLSKLQRGMHFKEDGAQDTSGTDLLFTSREAYDKYLDKLKIRRRLSNR